MSFAHNAALLTSLSIIAMSFAAEAQVPARGAKPIPAGAIARIDRRPPGPAPERLTLTALGPTTVRIAWTPVAGIRNYQIARAGPEGNVSIPVSAEPLEIDANGKPLRKLRPSYVDTGRMPGAQYLYYVIASYPPTSQYSDGSTSAAITMPPGLPPAGLTAATTGATVVLSWQPIADASGYLVIRDNATISAQPVRTTTYTDSGVASGVHSYRVAAYYRVQSGEIEGEIQKAPVLQVVVSHCAGSH